LRGNKRSLLFNTSRNRHQDITLERITEFDGVKANPADFQNGFDEMIQALKLHEVICERIPQEEKNKYGNRSGILVLIVLS